MWRNHAECAAWQLGNISNSIQYLKGYISIVRVIETIKGPSYTASAVTCLSVIFMFFLWKLISSVLLYQPSYQRVSLIIHNKSMDACDVLALCFSQMKIATLLWHNDWISTCTNACQEVWLVCWTRFLLPEKITFSSEMIDQSVVLLIIYRWRHMAVLSVSVSCNITVWYQPTWPLRPP